ncbi:Alpha amylase [Elusimicrobium minutum Pei191]|uniref:Alpha amylase n=1 Tax=Elusimicrobium minutum (strain Pei191) TaxID=445932 RepID=B2KAP0_ELUMP|nr:alpha-amylase family glycosyl hydrolase [Elusimicrobium minutum]ACC97586.1 Alpha amylase [Elusimicrobium minutum Pei191]
MRTNPHILEINTAVWLNKLSEKYGKKIPLCHVPDEELDKFKKYGFDAVWLMGIWKRSPEAREVAQNNEEIKRAIAAFNPNYDKKYIAGSPYAIYDYTIDPDLGTEDGLKNFRQRLNERGVALLLDFVGNHFAIDHPQTLENPDFFINTGMEAPAQNPEWFFRTEKGVFIAHGRDPYFPPWTDTAQLNYFNPKTQEYMLQCLERISSFCDGVRCDMSMLSLNKVMKDTWGNYLKYDYPKEEFWTKAVSKIKNINPLFSFIAEVYWGLEWDIQEMGFDYTYDKVLYDRLRFSTAEAIEAHLGAEHLFQMRSIRFISNHDEESALKAFGKEKSLAAAAIISTIPGAKMFSLDQILGHKEKIPVQYTLESEKDDEEIISFYQKLLSIINHPSFHGGQWTVKKVLSVNDSLTYKNVLCCSWVQGIEHKIVVINYSNAEAVCKVTLKRFKFKELKDDIAGKPVDIPVEEAYKNGITLQLKPYEIKIYGTTI